MANVATADRASIRAVRALKEHLEAKDTCYTIMLRLVAIIESDLRYGDGDTLSSLDERLASFP